MRSRIGSALAALLVLSACQIQVQGVAPGRTATVAKKEPKLTASPAPSPSASATLAASPAASLAPEVPTTVLEGSVKIDATYLIGQAGGNLIGQAGGNVIAVGGGNVISVGGGNVIATGGGNVIAVGGGNVIATGGGNYRALAADSLPLGTILPVKGMVVVAVSMLDDHQLGLAVATDENGRYTLEIPQGFEDKVRLYAAVPGKDANDPILENSRLWYNLLGNVVQDGSLVIDEDTVMASQMLRDIFREKFTYYLQITTRGEKEGKTADDIVHDENTPVYQQEALKAILAQLHDVVAKYAISEQEIPAVSRRLADRLLARMDLAGIKLNATTAKTWPGPETAALPAMVEVMRDLRTRTQEKMVAEVIGPNYVMSIIPQIDAANAIFATNNAQLPPGGTPVQLYPAIKKEHLDFKIERPSDMTQLMVMEFLTAGNMEFERLDFLLDDLLRPGEDQGTTIASYKTKIDAFGKAIAFYFGLELLKFANETDASGRNSLDALGAQFRAENPR